jgi:hypothetical protein
MGGWDHHQTWKTASATLPRSTMAAALLTDLKQRGMLDDTLVVG